jgi:hypothetical protein
MALSASGWGLNLLLIPNIPNPKAQTTCLLGSGCAQNGFVCLRMGSELVCLRMGHQRAYAHNAPNPEAQTLSASGWGLNLQVIPNIPNPEAQTTCLLGSGCAQNGFVCLRMGSELARKTQHPKS